MTQSFPPPTGTPVTTTSPAARASSTTVDAAASGTADVGKRFVLPTVTVLRASRLVAVLACLVASGVAAWVLMGTSDNLGVINRGTQQMLRLQQIKGDVLRADGLATNGLVQGTAAGSLTAYTDALTEAAKLTVEASQAQPLDQANLTEVNAGLLDYALTMERARSAYATDKASGAVQVQDAGSTLAEHTVPALDRLIAANVARVEDARASDRLWAAGLALVPVLLLVGISAWLARRTKRAVNIGLLVALAASVVLWRLVDANLVQSASVVDSAKAGSLQTATAAATAYSKLAEAKSVEGRQLLMYTTPDKLEASWAAAMSEVDAAVKKVSDAGVVKGVASYAVAHGSLVDLLGKNMITEAKKAAADTTTGVTPSYAAASDGLSKVFDAAKAATASGMTAQQDGLQIASILAGLLGLLGAIASWIGIGQRLREYR